MPTKIKPKKGWKPGGPASKKQVTGKYFSDDAFDKIAALLKVDKIDQAAKEMLDEAALIYTLLKKTKDEAPSTNEQKAALNDVYKGAKALSDSLKNLDSQSRVHLALAYGSRYPVCESLDISQRHTIRHDNFEKMLNEPHKIYLAAKWAKDTLPSVKPGPHKVQSALRSFIAALADIFYHLTGRNAPQPNHVGEGIFIDFVRFCLEHIKADESIEGTALVSAIKTTLQKKYSQSQ